MQKLLSIQMKKILITGGSGLVGQKLTQILQSKGYKVAWLSRNPKLNNQDVEVFKWDWTINYLEEKALPWCEHIIHLAGAGIADKRWTKKRKKILIDSRVETANILFNKISEHNISIKTFISASGIGYYGARTTQEIYSENDAPHNDFISQICVDWENAADKFETLGAKVVKLRTGVVLTKTGGALAKMITPIKWYFGSPIGTGKQFFPWIHVYDLCNLYLFCIENQKIVGTINAVAPDIQTNSSFSHSLANILHRPMFMPNVPSFIIKLIFGEMASIILEGSFVSSKKAIKMNFSFKFTKLKLALENLLNN